MPKVKTQITKEFDVASIRVYDWPDRLRSWPT